MPLDNLSELSTFIGALSLATERLVVIIKTLFPTLGVERPPQVGKTNDESDRLRRLSVLGVAYACALVTGWLIADGWTVSYGTQGRELAVPFVALLATGGSAFWAQVVSFASAAKDVRQYERQRLKEDAAPQQILAVASTGGAPTHLPVLPVLPNLPR